jgi:hypothetical protein
MNRYHALSVILALLMGACAVPPLPAATSQDERTAHDILQTFFNLLNEGQYAEAVSLYGGPYDSMRDNNPSIPPADLVALMHNACDINGIQCLKPKSITLEKTTSSGEFLFRVEFQNQDGSLFIRGPCCGASPTDQPPQSVFLYTVVKTPQGHFQVMDMPPYVP